MSPCPSLGAAWGGRRGGARAFYLPPGSELRPFPVRSRVGDQRGLRPRSSQSARAPWRPELRQGSGRAPGGPRVGEGRVVIPVPGLQALGAAESPYQKYTRASQRRPPYASSGRTAHSRHVPLASGLLQGRVLASQARWARLPAGALLARPLHDPGGSSQPRTCISESSRAPLLAPDARGAGPGRASVQGAGPGQGKNL